MTENFILHLTVFTHQQKYTVEPCVILSWEAHKSMAKIYLNFIFIDLPKALALLTTPINTTVLRDTAMKLNCSTDANPDAHTYHFYFNGNLTGNSSSGVFNISVKEDGEYTCVPGNKVGTGSNASVSITPVGECWVRLQVEISDSQVQINGCQYIWLHSKVLCTLFFLSTEIEGNTPFKLHVIGEMFQANLF